MGIVFTWTNQSTSFFLFNQINLIGCISGGEIQNKTRREGGVDIELSVSRPLIGQLTECQPLIGWGWHSLPAGVQEYTLDPDTEIKAGKIRIKVKNEDSKERLSS